MLLGSRTFFTARVISRTPPAKDDAMAKSPLAIVKEKFKDKKSLVKELEKFTGDDLWVSRENKDKGLAHVSNAKLLRLHTIFAEVKDKFGSRAKLIDAIVELLKRGKDEGFKARLGNYPVPRLYDMYKSTQKRLAPEKKAEKKAARKKEAAAAAPAKKAAAKAPAKKTAAKKTKKK
jgi:hypothetical protein